MKSKFVIISLVVVILVLLAAVENPARRFLLGLVYQETITPEDLKLSYNDQRFKILLVPGHDNLDSGAEFRGVKEADLNLLIAKKLHLLLAANPHFQVTLTRDLDSGEYTQIFTNFIETNKDRILAFRERKKSIFKRLLQSGDLTSAVGVSHNFAPSEVALRLHGINLWANENDVDLTLHLHVNDYAGRKFDKSGSYRGLSIYVPEKQYPNSRASLNLGQSLFRDLQQSLPASDLPKEDKGVVEDQELIAIGSYASRDGAAVLIEYGYIYEPRWATAGERELAATELAERTYDGLINYLEPTRVSLK